MKICNTCRESKSLNEFHNKKSSEDGKQPKCKICNNQSAIKWKKSNPECYRDYQSKYQSKYQQNHRSILENRLKDSIRTQYNKVISKKYRHDIIKVLGCSIKDFITYLEKQFDEKMNWENYGKYWEIDHIYPKSKGGIYHYSNTQPLSIKENRIKYNIICNNQKPIVY